MGRTRIRGKQRSEVRRSVIWSVITVYDDIQRYGVEEEEFIKGIIYLLYKKKDKTKIENYRPITLLETDYKILTKVIAKRLGKFLETLIHPDQAGFVHGRTLFDHTKLASLIPEYAKEEGNEELIVSLD